MNKNALLLILLLLIISQQFTVYGQTGDNIGNTKVKLRLPSDLYFEMSPYRKVQNKIVFNVDFLLKDLAVVTSDNKTSKIILQQAGRDTMKKKKIGYLIATPIFDSIVGGRETAIYYFGKGGGEDSVNEIHAAAVKVFFSDDSEPSTKLVRIKDRMKFNVPVNKFRNLKGSNSELGKKRMELEFIRVETPGSKKATLTIDQEPRRGNVLVCIFNATNGNLLAALDPKQPNQSFTTRNDVYIFPLVRPFVTSTPTGTKITFQVGDPKVNGSVTASEE